MACLPVRSASSLSVDWLASFSGLLVAYKANFSCLQFQNASLEGMISLDGGLHTYYGWIGSGCSPEGPTGAITGPAPPRLSTEVGKCRTGLGATVQGKTICWWWRVSLFCVLFCISEGLSFPFHVSLFLAIHPVDSSPSRPRGGCFM